jgi:hypothetical protein
MDDENVIEELRALRGVLRYLLYSIWALGAMQNVRAQTGSQSEEHVPLNLKSPEGRKLALNALDGFLTLAQFAMDEHGKPDSTFAVPPPWKM